METPDITTMPSTIATVCCWKAVLHSDLSEMGLWKIKKRRKANIIESLTLGNKQADQYLPATDSLMQVYAANDPSRQKKHPWKAALEAFAINVGVQCFDQFVMNEDFAKSLSTVSSTTSRTDLYGIMTNSLPTCLLTPIMEVCTLMLQEATA